MKSYRKVKSIERKVCLVGALSGGICSLTGCDDNSERDRFNAYLHYIIPGDGESRTYDLGDSRQVVVSFRGGNGFFERRELTLVVNDSIKFVSHLSSNDDLYRQLGELYLRDGERWEKFDWRSPDIWQRRYENLVNDLYNKRMSFETKWRKKFDEEIMQKKEGK